MPAARSTHAPIKRKALSEAPINRQQAPTSPLKPLSPTKAATLKSAFSVTKNSSQADVPKKGVKGNKVPSPFAATKSVLHRSTAAPQIVGREAEQDTIRKFLRSTVEKGSGGSMYISGNPGTGKTACLQAIIKQSSAKFASVLVNCVPLTRPGQVYAAVLEALDKPAANADSSLDDLENLVFSSKSAVLVILDEVDSLLGSRQEVLYRLFELATHPDSRLALVGIANALDLTDRFLPRLQARNCEPTLLNFNPYQVKDIVAILQSRLDSVATKGADPVIQKAALELCARKVAATSGDLRKALDVCRQAMESAETESKRKAKSVDKENAASDAVQAQGVAPLKVSIMHIAKVLTSINGSPIAQKLEALNFQQKLVLCAYASLARADTPVTSKRPAAAGNVIAVASLYSEYVSICSRLSMLAPVTRTEFLDLVAMMETQGVVTIEASKAGRRCGVRRRIVATAGAADDRAVRLAVDDADIRRTLEKTPALIPLL
ncbi:AAA ATPase [Coemansia sp. RSA 1813]|nr:AAA ATPase [Coemansia sp. RSA 1843]KAJ2217316.1 AAA ATPase [Coemansia sp. RSA 487]KAJ2572540.1 AAA ATPase [Coemansia sp. RSA 1813]